MAAERAAFVTTWFDEIWNKGRLDAIDELLAEDGIVHGLGEAGGEVSGPAAFRPFVERLRGAFPDIEVKVEQVVDDGDLIAARWVATMTHTGDHLGMPASGKRVTVTGMSMTRLRDGKLVEGWNNWDMLSLMQQVDAIQPAAQLLP
jgi:steroid delta-isomerase-like uncharacterized protein